MSKILELRRCYLDAQAKGIGKFAAAMNMSNYLSKYGDVVATKLIGRAFGGSAIYINSYMARIRREASIYEPTLHGLKDGSMVYAHEFLPINKKRLRSRAGTKDPKFVIHRWCGKSQSYASILKLTVFEMYVYEFKACFHADGSLRTIVDQEIWLDGYRDRRDAEFTRECVKLGGTKYHYTKLCELVVRIGKLTTYGIRGDIITCLRASANLLEKFHKKSKL